jgi:hypothetical protein
MFCICSKLLGIICIYFKISDFFKTGNPIFHIWTETLIESMPYLQSSEISADFCPLECRCSPSLSTLSVWECTNKTNKCVTMEVSLLHGVTKGLFILGCAQVSNVYVYSPWVSNTLIIDFQADERLCWFPRSVAIESSLSNKRKTASANLK